MELVTSYVWIGKFLSVVNISCTPKTKGAESELLLSNADFVHLVSRITNKHT